MSCMDLRGSADVCGIEENPNTYAAGLGQENGFERCSSGVCTCREECNKYDLTTTQLFLNDLS